MVVLAKHLLKANIVRMRQQITVGNRFKSAPVVEKSCPAIVASHNYDVKSGLFLGGPIISLFLLCHDYAATDNYKCTVKY